MYETQPAVPQIVRSRAPEGSRIYAVGDIHGCVDQFDRLMSIIEDDAGRHPSERLVLVFLGDYVDRGPGSREVVDRLLAGPPSAGPMAGAEWVCLKGNHEETMIRFLTEPSVGPNWCRNGGLDTIRSYAGDLPEGAEGDMLALQLTLSRALPPRHLRFLSRLPLSHQEGDYLFVHAGIRPGVALEDQEPSDLMWIRDDFLFDPSPFEKVVVHGHTISPLPEVRPNRIGVDTGCYRTGRLTALVLDGPEKGFLVA